MTNDFLERCQHIAELFTTGFGVVSRRPKTSTSSFRTSTNYAKTSRKSILAKNKHDLSTTQPEIISIYHFQFNYQDNRYLK